MPGKIRVVIGQQRTDAAAYDRPRVAVMSWQIPNAAREATVMENKCVDGSEEVAGDFSQEERCEVIRDGDDGMRRKEDGKRSLELTACPNNNQ